jgi:hypothetical protein
MIFKTIKSLFVAGLVVISQSNHAETTFTKPMTEIAAEFEKATGHSAK